MTSIKTLHGIGDARAKFFEQRNINTIEDLLYFFPRAYEDRSKNVDISDLEADTEVCVCARVFSPVRETRIRNNMILYQMKVVDDTGVMSVLWYNNKYVKNQFRTGDEYIFYGKITYNRRMWEMVNPIYERHNNRKYTGKIMPIYPISTSITQKSVQSATEQALEHIGEICEYIPADIRNKYNLAEINFSLKNIHYPTDENAAEIARRRFAFEELYLLQTALLNKKGISNNVKKNPFTNIECIKDFISSLPFPLTGAQKRVLDEICNDFTSGKLMMRLVQGDVGSGKTAVAAAAMYTTVKNGYQTVIMAPTEILAAQHFETFSEFFKNTDMKIALLTGSTKKKKDLYSLIASGQIDIIIGTHAVIQKDVEYKNLGLVVADEQHRFGVSQRAALSNKGNNPHFLVMTATPIPRTLALILYGDLDISILDELPPGRKPVATYAVGEGMRTRINNFLKKNIDMGSQAYVVCPLIEETEKSDLQNATELSIRLKNIFPQYSIGLIHGKMKPKEKDEVMTRFVNNEIQILVSTTVIEVGVNVPNSNIMIIENAERFGLSQLHQLRGRVGRGCEQAYCILFSDGGTDVTKKRLETMCKSNDGFYISEQDLKLRGPGDFFGTRQHGLPELKVANLFEDMHLLKQAQEAAIKTFKGEIKFKDSEKEILFKKINALLSEDIIIN